MLIKRTHDKFYLKENYKNNPKEYFKLIEAEARTDLKLDQDSSITWIDIGCETGSFLYYLRELYPRIEFTGMDVMSELLDHLNDDIVGKKIVPFLGDIMDKAMIPKKRFDVVSMTGVIQIFDEWEIALDNTLRLMKDTGILYMLSVFNPEPYDVFVKYKPSVSRGELEAGWNMIAVDSIKQYGEKKGYCCDCIPFKINIDIPRNQDDPVRSWTIRKEEGDRMIINGLQLVNNHFLFKIKKR
ncbi:Methyltransferase domain-containing protein [Lachnospiraceae bacterium]|nr:Methyltransferase domain-containing protein [Lachnospiraceae bacterium]